MSQISREAGRERTGYDDLPEDAQALMRLLSGRYSCRSYLPDQVPRTLIEQMLGMAQLSASWCNSQPWHAIVTGGAGTERLRAALYDHAVLDQAPNGSGDAVRPDFPFPTAYRGVYKERQREVGWQLYESVGVTYGDRVGSGRQALENYRMFGAPHVLILTSERDLGVYGAIDVGLYVGSLLLAAESLGLGMIPQAALAAYAPLLREELAIPDNRMVVLGASFGYADRAHAANSFRSGRAPLDSAVQWVMQ